MGNIAQGALFATSTRAGLFPTEVPVPQLGLAILGGVAALTGSPSSNIPWQPTIANVDGNVADGMNNAFYNRLLVEPSEISFGSVASTQVKTFSIFNAFFNAVNLDSTTFTQDSGLTIQGITAPAVVGSLQESLFTLTAGTNGPPVIAGLYEFVFAGQIGTVTVTATGTRTVLLPFMPGQRFGESLRFNTHIMTAYSGKETRSRVRRKPLQSFSIDSLLKVNDIAYAENVLSNWRNKTWAIPVWQEARLASPFIEGATSVDCDTTYADFRVGGLAVLYNSLREFDVFQILEFDATSITLERGLSFGSSTALIIPVRSGFMKSPPTRTSTGVSGRFTAELIVQDTIKFDAATVTQYKSIDVFVAEPEYSSSKGVVDTYTSRIDVMQTESSNARQLSPWTENKKTRKFTLTLDTQQKLWEARLWLHRCSGRLKEFWMSSFENDFRLIGDGIVGNSMLCKKDGYTDASTNKDIAIHLKDGSILFAEIAGASDTSDTTTLALDQILTIDYLEIAFVSHLALVRFNSDDFEIKWSTNGYGQINLTTIEVPA